MPEPPPISATCSNSFAFFFLFQIHMYEWLVSSEGRTFVGELGDGALDAERVARLEPLVHVLAQRPALVFLDEQHELARVLRARHGRVRAHDGVPVLVARRAVR